MSESEWDLEAFLGEVQHGCAVIKLSAGLLAAAALFAYLQTVPGMGADALLRPAGTVISYIFAILV